MAIRFQCGCGGRLQAHEAQAGRRTQCPQCGAVLTIPAPPPAVEPDQRRNLVTSAEDAYELSDPEPEETSSAWTTYQRPGGQLQTGDETNTWPEPAALTRWTEEASRPSTNPRREFLHWVLILALVPLAFSLLGGHSDDVGRRLQKTVDQAPPEVQREVSEILVQMEQGHKDKTDLLRALPDGKIDAEAHLAIDSMRHWVYALFAAVGFLGLISLFFTEERDPLHLLLVGLFTGTIGIVFLLGVQFAASFTQTLWLRGGNVLVLIFYIVKFIGWSYSSALDPDSNFLLSAIGFTFGVGLCEELCKALPVIGYYQQHAERDAMGWRGACLWGLASGVGFGVSEGIMYSGDHYNGIFGVDTYVVRFVSCVALHAMWSASTAMTLCRNRDLLRGVEHWFQYFLVLLRFIAVPMVLHGLYDTLLKKDQNEVALIIGLVSFAWFAVNIEWSKRFEIDDQDFGSARASSRRATRTA